MSKNPNNKDTHDASVVDETLFKSRNVLVFGEINMESARKVVSNILALAFESDAPINVFVNSPGGHVESGDSIFDTIRFIKNKVNVIGTGWVGSIAGLIYLSVPKERRFTLPNTRFLIHQPSGGARGQSTDIQIQAKEILKTKERLATIIAESTQMSYEKVFADMDRDFWLSAEEAKKYGIVGKIIKSFSEIS